MTGLGKPLQDPATFEKNDGAIAPVLPVALDWPPADFFFRTFFRGGRPKIPAAQLFWGFRREYARLHHVVQRPLQVGPRGAQMGAQGPYPTLPLSPLGPWGVLGALSCKCMSRRLASHHGI